MADKKNFFGDVILFGDSALKLKDEAEKGSSISEVYKTKTQANNDINEAEKTIKNTTAKNTPGGAKEALIHPTTGIFAGNGTNTTKGETLLKIFDEKIPGKAAVRERLKSRVEETVKSGNATPTQKIGNIFKNKKLDEDSANYAKFVKNNKTEGTPQNEDLGWVTSVLDITGSKNWTEFIDNAGFADLESVVAQVKTDNMGMVTSDLVGQMEAIIPEKKRMYEASKAYREAEEKEKSILNNLVAERTKELQGVKAEDYIYEPKIVISIPEGADEGYRAYVQDLYAQAEELALSNVYSIEEMDVIEKNTRNNAKKMQKDYNANIINTAKTNDDWEEKSTLPKSPDYYARTRKTEQNPTEAALVKLMHKTMTYSGSEENETDKFSENQLRSIYEATNEQKMAICYLYRTGGADKVKEYIDTFDDKAGAKNATYAVNDSAFSLAWVNKAEKMKQAEDWEKYSTLENNYKPDVYITSGFGLEGDDAVRAKYLSDDEQKTLIYIINSGTAKGEDWQNEGKSYFKSLTGELNRRQASDKYKKAAAFADKHPVLASLSSLDDTAIDSVRGLSYMVTDPIKIAVSGVDKNYDTNAPRFNYQRSREAIMNTVKDKIDSDFGDFMYDTVMSAADNVARVGVSAGAGFLIGGGAGAAIAVKYAAPVLMSGGAYQSGMKDALDRGADNTTAMIYGYASAANELVTEHIGMNKLADSVTKVLKGGKISKAIISSMVAEGLEEGANALIELLYDDILMGEKSTYNSRIQHYLDRGKTEAEAHTLAVRDTAIDCWTQAAAGALSGGLLSAGGIAIGKGAESYKKGEKVQQIIYDADMLRYELYKKNSWDEDAQKIYDGATELLAQAKNETKNKKTINSITEREQKLSAIRDKFVAGDNAANVSSEGKTALTAGEVDNPINNVGGDETAVSTAESQGLQASEKTADAINIANAENDVNRAERFTEDWVNKITAWDDNAKNAYQNIKRDLEAIKNNAPENMQSEYDRLLKDLEKKVKNKVAHIDSFARLKMEIPSAEPLTVLDAIDRIRDEIKENEKLAAESVENDGNEAIENRIKELRKKESQLKLIQKLSDKGVHVNMYSASEANAEGIKTPNGVTIGDDIYINIDSTDPLAKTMGHEMLHLLKNENQEAYNNILDIVKKGFSGKNAEARISYLKEKYGERYSDYYDLNDENFDELFWEEYAADVMGDMSDKNAYGRGILNEILNSDLSTEKKKTAVRAFAEGLRKLIVKVRSVIGKGKYKNYAEMQAYEFVNNAIEVHKEAVKAYRDLVEGRVSEGNKKTAAGADVKMSVNNHTKYDYSKPFSEQIEDWKQGKIPLYDSLIVCKTPNVLINIGFNALPVTINQTHVDYALNGTKDMDHKIGETILKQLPEALKKPIAIITSTSTKNRVVAILNFKHNGKNIVAPIEIDGYARNNNVRIDSNAIASIFGKTNAVTKLINEAIKAEQNGNIGIFFWNKKEAQSLLQGAGLQLPSGLPQDGFIHSIRESGSPVKPKFKNVTETQQFKRWFGDWKNNPKKASKVVNADGTPKVVYHQTAENFTVFYTKHEGNGTTDNETPFGIFLKPTDENIGIKGDIQMPLYANIQNPLIVQNREEFVSKIKNMSEEFTELYNESNELDIRYEQQIENAKEQTRRYIEEWKKKNPNASSRDIYQDETYLSLDQTEDDLVDAWQADAKALSIKAKTAIVEALENNGYDGVFLKEDIGSWGRKTETYIALHENQVKSATDNIGTFDKNNPDIRFSVPSADVIEQRAELENRGYEIETAVIKRLEAALDTELSEKTREAVKVYSISEAMGDRERISASREKLVDSIEKNENPMFEARTEDEGFTDYLKGLKDKVYVSDYARQGMSAADVSRTFGVGKWSSKEGLPVDVLYDNMKADGITLPEADTLQDKLIALRDRKAEIRDVRQEAMPRSEIRNIVDYAVDLEDYTNERGISEDVEIPGLYGESKTVQDAEFMNKRRELESEIDSLDDNDYTQKRKLREEKNALEKNFVEKLIRQGRRRSERGIYSDFCRMDKAEEAAARARIARSENAAREADIYARVHEMTQDMRGAARALAEGSIDETRIDTRYKKAEDRARIKELSELYRRVDYTNKQLREEQRTALNEACDILFKNASYMRNPWGIQGQIDTFEAVVNYICKVDSIKENLKSIKENLKSIKENMKSNIPTDVRQELLWAAEKINEVFYYPIQENTRLMNEWKDKYLNKLKELGIRKRSAESAAAQALGEGFLNLYDLDKAGFNGEQKAKIIELANYLEDTYKEVLQQINAVRFTQGEGDIKAPTFKVNKQLKGQISDMQKQVNWIKMKGQMNGQKLKNLTDSERLRVLESNKIKKCVADAYLTYGDMFEYHIDWREQNPETKSQTEMQQWAWNLLMRGKKYDSVRGTIEMDYFPHMEKDDAMGKVLQFLNVKQTIDTLPTAINGMTENFRPNKKWSPFMQERLGNETEFDAVTGAERYFDSVGQYIYHSGDIVKIRILENYIRQRFNAEGSDRYCLSNFASYLRDYGDYLAGKQYMLDRFFQKYFGRKAAQGSRLLMNNVSKNQISYNLGTAITNSAVYAQGISWVIRESIYEKDITKLQYALRRNDSIKEHIKKSTFLTNRFHDDIVLKDKSWVRNAVTSFQNKGFWLMGVIDKVFVTRVHQMMTGVYMSQGMSEENAIMAADVELRKLAASREYGETPLIYSANSLSIITKYTLEPVNQMRYYKSEIGRMTKAIMSGGDDAPKAAILALLAFLAGYAVDLAITYGVNKAFKKVKGYPVFTDPVQMTIDTGEGIRDGKPGGEIWLDILDEIPIVSNVVKAANGNMAELIGVGAVANFFGNIAKFIVPGGDDPDWGEVIWNGIMMFNPLGAGAQAKKMVNAYMYLTKGYQERKQTDAYGNEYYVVQNATDATAWDWFVGLVFGKSAIPSVQEWHKNNYTKLSKQSSEVFKTVVDEYDLTPEEVYDMLMEYDHKKKEAKNNDTDYSVYKWVTEDIDKYGKFTVDDKYYLWNKMSKRDCPVPDKMENPEKKIAQVFIATGNTDVLIDRMSDEFSIDGHRNTTTKYYLSEEQQDKLQAEYERILFKEIMPKYMNLKDSESFDNEEWVEFISNAKSKAKAAAQEKAVAEGWYYDSNDTDTTPEDTFEIMKQDREKTGRSAVEAFWIYCDKTNNSFIIPDWENPTKAQQILAETFVACEKEPEGLLPSNRSKSFSEKGVTYLLNEEQYEEFNSAYFRYYWDEVEKLETYSQEARIGEIQKIRNNAHAYAKQYILKKYKGQVETEE